MIRGTKDRPPQRGSLKRGVTAGIEKSLTNRNHYEKDINYHSKYQKEITKF